jgi:hypothetical protein
MLRSFYISPSDVWDQSAQEWSFDDAYNYSLTGSYERYGVGFQDVNVGCSLLTDYRIKRSMATYYTAQISGMVIQSISLQVWDSAGYSTDPGISFEVVDGLFTTLPSGINPTIFDKAAFGEQRDANTVYGSIPLQDMGGSFEIPLTGFEPNINSSGYTKIGFRLTNDRAYYTPTGWNAAYIFAYLKIYYEAVSPGYIWVEGTKFHYTDVFGQEREFEGSYIT